MTFTVADYVLTRLAQQRVDALFGVPGAYCADLFGATAAHGITAVVTASDLEAGYAADGYARTKGLGAVAVANGVGVLSMINAIGGAFVERSPVVVLNGGPSCAHLDKLKKFDVLFSHSTGRPDADLTAYKLVTASAVRAEKAADVPALVDGALTTALRTKKPVYVEIAEDLWTKACPSPTGSLSAAVPPSGTEKQLAAAIVAQIRAATSPVLLIGAEVQRYGLADRVADLIAKLGVRWSSALLAKSTLPEQGNGWVGVYDPPHSAPAAADAVEHADLLVTLGCVFPSGYAHLVTGGSDHIIAAYDGKVKIRTGAKQNAEIGALVTALVTEAAKAPPRPSPPALTSPAPGPPTGALTYRGVFERIAAALDASWIVVPDIFLGVYSAANLPVKGRDAFLCSAVWASIGHSVAASVGAAFGSSRRPLVICGDGGFHMTAQALSTMARYNRNPVVIVIDNALYAYEQFLVDGDYFTHPGTPPTPYLTLNKWNFTQLAQGLGLTSAQSVNTEADFDTALAAAKASAEPALIAAEIDPHDLPAELP
ncbi:Alpha-keto-acid decarboxylase [Actinomadura rubteroloni]|uniref:Alpha-keto-acid decarboxylase n=1 Tax=Actinomadura rubteroloni TaxID=1926885 RepID=A0A2P4ULM8_9ACTN|nr:thiamine pyrophosphate-dependent enzyme [Actinomadura rubteroloni]POM25953.1 Alpha-keto-acid decarboxylase [Actinomadura rubteroloni]